MERISTGIDGLDIMLRGGLIRGRSYLIVGGPGTGKTTLGIQFLREGAISGEKSVYISLEEPISEIKENMAVFGWSLDKLLLVDLTPGAGLVTLSDDTAEGNIGSMDLFEINSRIETILKNERPDRIVFDSVTMFSLLFPNEYNSRRSLLDLMNRITEYGATSLFILEKTVYPGDIDTDFSYFLARGIIKLFSLYGKGERKRGIQIEKMRGGCFDEQLRPMEITDSGIVVHHNSLMI